MSLYATLFVRYIFTSAVFVISSSCISSVKADNVETKMSQERIVTDLSDIRNGVPVDYQYNETSTESSSMISAPGCPKSIDGYPWIYYGEPVKCYLAGDNGPCKSGEILFVETNSSHGLCNCDCFERVRIEAGQNSFCKKLNSEFAFVPEERKCYSLYEQGPCQPNQWLAKSVDESNGTVAICETRRCPLGHIPNSYALHFDDSDTKNFSCYQPFRFANKPLGSINKFLQLVNKPLSNINSNGCKNDEMFSDILQKCIKKFPPTVTIG